MLTSLIKSSLGRDIGVLFQLLPQAFNAQLSSVSDLTSAQLIFMMMLKVDGPMGRPQAQKDCRMLDLEPTDTLSFLQRKRYVALTVPEASIALTSEGEQVLAKLWPIHETTEKKLLAGFSEAENAQLRALLRRLQENAEQIIRTV